MITTIWLLGIVAFLIYDHIIGIGHDKDRGPVEYFGMAIFWFISFPILFIKLVKDRKSFVEKS
jgi:hypothetical protein